MAVTGWGTGNYLSSASAPFTGPEIAMQIWFYPANITTQFGMFNITSGVDLGDVIGLYALGATAGDPVAMYGRASNNSNPALSGTGFSANVWNHALGIRASATDRRAWCNGGTKGTNTTSRSETVDRITIGRAGYAWTSNEFPMDGPLAHAAIWDLSVWPGANAAARADSFEAIIPALAAGYSPTCFPLGLKSYHELCGRVASFAEPDFVGANNLAMTGSLSQSAQPRIIVPGRKRLVVPAAAAAAPGGPLIRSRLIEGSLVGGRLVL